MKLFKKMMAIGLSLALCGSVVSPAFAEDTLSDELLKPGKDDIITEADGNAQDLLDGTNAALKNPSKEEGETVTKGDIVGEDGKVIVNDGSVLDQAANAITNADDTKDAVDAALKVGEDDVNAAVNAETTKADQALKDAQAAAEAAAKAVENKDQAALDQAKKDADAAAKRAEDAYNSAQSIFDGVIDNLLKGEDGQISEETQAAIDAKVAEILAEKGTTVEEADEAELVSVLNAAKAAVANAKIAELYGDANEQIEAAQEALDNAQIALEIAKGNYNDAVEAAKVLNEGTTSDIEAYVKFFDGLNEDKEMAQKVADAYGKVDSAKDAADAAKSAADAKEPEDSTAETTGDRIDRDQQFLTEKINSEGAGNITYISGDFQLKHAIEVVETNSKTIVENIAKLKTATDAQEISELKAQIEQAYKAIYVDKYNYGSSTVGTLLQTADELIALRSNTNHNLEALPVNKGIKAAMDRLTTNLGTLEAEYNQMLAEEALKKTLAEVTDGLSYKEALDVVETFAKDENLSKREELKDAAEKLAAQKQVAEAAAQKVADAEAAYQAALRAVQDAMDSLKNKQIDAAAAQAKLSAALGNLEQAKQKKEEAEGEKKKADDAVIETEDEIRDIIGGDDYFDFGDLTTIDDEAVPLAAGPVTRAEFIDYLWRHEGEPASAGVCTFTDVENTHEFFAALCWADENGVAEAYFDAQGHEDGTFEPDELVTVEAVRDILDNFAQVFGTNAVAADDLTTLSGEDDEAVLNCDEVLAEFFGEEYAAPELDEAA